MEKLDTVLQHPRDQITEIIKRIYNAGLTATSGGNISIKDDEGNIWVTPSAIDKGTLQRKDIVCVKPDGTILGHYKPSSEFPFHKAIYETRPDLTAVIHAHPPALVSFSIVRKLPNMNIIRWVNWSPSTTIRLRIYVKNSSPDPVPPLKEVAFASKPAVRALN